MSSSLSVPVSILMYHQVGRFNRPDKHRGIYCDVGRFRQQMAYLARFCQVISLADANEALFFNKPITGKRAVVLTFDDGCRNFAEYAWPIMKEHRFPVTMFLVADLIGKTTSWITDIPESDHAPLMDLATLRALKKEGVSFGSHTLNHVKLSECSFETARTEIFDSKKKLEDLLGDAVPDFCYPFGKYNQQAKDLVIKAGYKTALTCVRAEANYAPDPCELPRKAISYGDNMIGFWWKLYMKRKPKEAWVGQGSAQK
ncbi:MAG: polysaccharide deacetylase family protein [Burkholderiales bacterium]|jgi:peptidoglycan/xylan/chitin deacetylase (PgdA/CDA1 family)|nr:polysaccharide deacetylase family protein [Burkholderiales bacterium]